MELGLFLQPAISPKKSLKEANDSVLAMIKACDELGYSEAWIGEHFTAEWEPICSPDIIVAQALQQTKNIKLAAGAHVLPYHNPVELAHRVAYMDHLAQGRLMLGVASGGLPSDWELFGVDGKAGEHREMTSEALEIMFKIWTEEELTEYKGKYWNVGTPKTVMDGIGMHIKPFQKPFPPIGVAGSNANSGTLRLAGEYGFLPMSLGVTARTAYQHWDCVLEGAAISGKTPDRDTWRIVNQTLVADTDEEALDLAINGAMGEAWREYFIPLYKKSKMLSKFKHRDDVPDEEVTVEYLAKNTWYVGSPDTVAKKMDELYEGSGGFGTLLVTGYDYSDNFEAWKKSMRLLKEEVLPRMQNNRKVFA